MRVLLMLIVLCLGALPAAAADRQTVAEIVQRIREDGRATSKPPYTSLRLERKGGKPLVLMIIDGGNGVVHFGIYTEITIGAKESDYDHDTPCLLRLEDNGADGVVDNYKLECIAWTPKLKPYMEKHYHRLFDELLLEAKDLLGR